MKTDKRNREDPRITPAFTYASYYDRRFQDTAPQKGDVVCGRTLSSRGDSTVFRAIVLGVDEVSGTVCVRAPAAHKFDNRRGAGHLWDIAPMHLGLIERAPS